MNLAQLFVTLGVKGAKETVGALGKVTGLLKESKSNALLLKGSILGAFYGIQRMFAGSNQAGTALLNMSEATGMAIKNLQQYQWAAKEVGLTNEEMASTFLNLKNIASQIATGTGQAPAGLGALLGLTGQDVNMFEFAKDPEKFFRALIDATQIAQSTGAMDKSMVDQYLSGVGISNFMASGIRRGIFDPSNLSKAPTQSDAQIRSIDKIRLAWDRLFERIERKLSDFNAKHGADFISSVSQITDKLLLLADSLIKLGDALNVGGVLKWLTDSATDKISSVTTGLSAITGDEKAQGRVKSALSDLANNPLNALTPVQKYAIEALASKAGQAADVAASEAKAISGVIQQVFNFNGVVPQNPQTISDAARDGAKKAYQQFGNAAVGGQ